MTNLKQAKLSEEALGYNPKFTSLTSQLGYVSVRPDTGLPFKEEEIAKATPQRFIDAVESIRELYSSHGADSPDPQGIAPHLFEAAADVARAKASGDRDLWVQMSRVYQDQAAQVAAGAQEGTPLQVAANELRVAVGNQSDVLHRRGIGVDIEKVYGKAEDLTARGVRPFAWGEKTPEATGTNPEDLEGVVRGTSTYYGFTNEAAAASDAMIKEVFGGEDTLAFQKFFNDSISSNFINNDTLMKESRDIAREKNYRLMKSNPMQILSTLETLGSDGEEYMNRLGKGQGSIDEWENYRKLRDKATKFVDEAPEIEDMLVRGRKDELLAYRRGGVITDDQMLKPDEENLVPEPPRHIMVPDPVEEGGSHKVWNPDWLNWKAATDPEVRIRYDFSEGDLDGPMGLTSSKVVSQYKEWPTAEVIDPLSDPKAFDLMGQLRPFFIGEDGVVSRYKRLDDNTVLRTTGVLRDENMKIFEAEDSDRAATLAKTVLSEMADKGLGVPETEAHFQTIIDTSPDPVARIEAHKAITRLNDFGNLTAKMVDEAAEGAEDDELVASHEAMKAKIIGIADRSGSGADSWSVRKALDYAELKFGDARKSLWAIQKETESSTGTPTPPEPDLGEGYANANSRRETRWATQAGANKLSKTIAESYGDDSPHIQELARRAVLDGAAATPESAMKFLKPYRDSVNAARTEATQKLWAGDKEGAEKILRGVAARSAALTSGIKNSMPVEQAIRELDNPENAPLLAELEEDVRITGGTTGMNDVAKGDFKKVMEAAGKMDKTLAPTRPGAKSTNVWDSPAMVKARAQLDEVHASLTSPETQELIAKGQSYTTEPLDGQPAIAAPAPAPAPATATPQLVGEPPALSPTVSPASTPTPAPAQGQAPATAPAAPTTPTTPGVGPALTAIDPASGTPAAPVHSHPAAPVPAAPGEPAPAPRQPLSILSAQTKGQPYLSAPKLVTPVAPTPPVEANMQQDFQAETGTPYDPKSKMDQANLQNMQTNQPTLNKQEYVQTTKGKPEAPPPTPQQVRLEARDTTRKAMSSGIIPEKDLVRANLTNKSVTAFNNKSGSMEDQWQKEGLLPLIFGAAMLGTSLWGAAKGLHSMALNYDNSRRSLRAQTSGNPLDVMRLSEARSLSHYADKNLKIDAATVPLSLFGTASMGRQVAGSALRVGSRGLGYAGRAVAANPGTKALAWGGRFSEGVSATAPGASRLSQAANALTRTGTSIAAKGNGIGALGAKLTQAGQDSAWTRSVMGVAGKGLTKLTGRSLPSGVAAGLDVGEAVAVGGGTALAVPRELDLKHQLDAIDTETMADAGLGSQATPLRRAKELQRKKEQQNVKPPQSGLSGPGASAPQTAK